MSAGQAPKTPIPPKPDSQITADELATIAARGLPNAEPNDPATVAPISSWDGAGRPSPMGGPARGQPLGRARPNRTRGGQTPHDRLRS